MARDRSRNEDEDQEERTSRRAPGLPRISVTLNKPGLRRKIRLAASLADMEVGDWAKAVLAQAATRTLEKHGVK